jgi:hypothetical protein
MNKYEKSVIEEFDKKFDYFLPACGFNEDNTPISLGVDIKQFILSSLQTQRELFIKCIPEEYDYLGKITTSSMQDWYDKGRSECRAELLENIKKI